MEPHGLALLGHDGVAGGDLGELLGVEHGRAFAQELEPPLHVRKYLQKTFFCKRIEVGVHAALVAQAQLSRDLWPRRRHAAHLEVAADDVERHLLAFG